MSSKHLLRLIVIWVIITKNDGRNRPPNCFPCSCGHYRTINSANCSIEILEKNSFTELGNVTSILKNITIPIETVLLQDLPINILITKKFNLFNENLRKLKKLNIINCQIEVINPGVFDQTYLKNLEKLQLSKNKLTDLEEHSFIGLVRLKYLFLDENQLKTLNGRDIFTDLIEVEEIDLSSNELYYLDDNLFVNNEYLQQIDLSNNRFQSINAALVNNNLNLKQFHVNENPWNCSAIEEVMFQLFQRNLYDTMSVCDTPEQFAKKSWIQYFNSTKRTTEIQRNFIIIHELNLTVKHCDVLYQDNSVSWINYTDHNSTILNHSQEIRLSIELYNTYKCYQVTIQNEIKNYILVLMDRNVTITNTNSLTKLLLKDTEMNTCHLKCILQVQSEFFYDKETIIIDYLSHYKEQFSLMLRYVNFEGNGTFTCRANEITMNSEYMWLWIETYVWILIGTAVLCGVIFILIGIIIKKMKICKRKPNIELPKDVWVQLLENE